MVGVLLSRPMLRAVSSVVCAATLGVLCGGGCGGVGAEGTCPALLSCGGDPSGTWTIQQACEFEAVRPTQPTDVMDFMAQPNTPSIGATLPPPQPQPTQLAPSTSGDWCFGLDYNDSQVKNVSLWHDEPVLQPGSTIVFDSMDHTYTATYQFSTHGPGFNNSTHFAPICLAANGANPPPTCTDLATGLTMYYAAGTSTPQPPNTFNDIKCTTSSSDGGCDCTYYFAVLVVDSGTWSYSGDTIFEQNSNFTYNGQAVKLASPVDTMQVTFCRQDGGGHHTLDLSGARGGSLSGLVGLRTMRLGM